MDRTTTDNRGLWWAVGIIAAIIIIFMIWGGVAGTKTDNTRAAAPTTQSTNGVTPAIPNTGTNGSSGGTSGSGGTNGTNGYSR